MGIIYVPSKRYKCSKCGSEKGKLYSRPHGHPLKGTYEGVKCPKCGHKTERYKPSMYELETQSTNVIGFNASDPELF